MDLTKIEGLNLTTEQQEAIMAQHTAGVNEATTGLVNKNNELLGEKKSAMQSVTDKEQALEDARQAAVKAQEEKLKLAGDVEGLKTHYETQLAEATATANAQAEKAQKALTDRDMSSAVNQIKSLIHDDFVDVSSDMLSNIPKISYNDDGLASFTYEYKGEKVADDFEGFKSWASEQASFQKILKGVDSSGANVKQSAGSAGASNKAYGEMSLAEQIQFNSTK